MASSNKSAQQRVSPHERNRTNMAQPLVVCANKGFSTYEGTDATTPRSAKSHEGLGWCIVSDYDCFAWTPMAPAERTRYRTRRITSLRLVKRPIAPTREIRDDQPAVRSVFREQHWRMRDFSNMAAALRCVFSLGTMPIECEPLDQEQEGRSVTVAMAERLSLRQSGTRAWLQAEAELRMEWAQNRRTRAKRHWPSGARGCFWRAGIPRMGSLRAGGQAMPRYARPSPRNKLMAPSEWCYMDGLAHCAPEHIRRPQQTGVSDL